jgi:hypothetical protein
MQTFAPKEWLEFLNAGSDIEFQLNIETDLVVEGDCSSFINLSEDDQIRWLHAIIAIADSKPKSVIVYARCCGQYNSPYQIRLERLFPDIVFRFPRVGDYFDTPHSCKTRIAEDMLKANILKTA